MPDNELDTIFSTSDRQVPVKEKIEKSLQILRDEIRSLAADHEKLGCLKERTRIITLIAGAMESKPDEKDFESRIRHAVYMNMIAELTEGSVR